MSIILDHLSIQRRERERERERERKKDRKKEKQYIQNIEQSAKNHAMFRRVGQVLNRE
jgi:hypothetical protein